MGGKGLKELAEINHEAACELADTLGGLKGVEVLTPQPEHVEPNIYLYPGHRFELKKHNRALGLDNDDSSSESGESEHGREKSKQTGGDDENDSLENGHQPEGEMQDAQPRDGGSSSSDQEDDGELGTDDEDDLLEAQSLLQKHRPQAHHQEPTE